MIFIRVIFDAFIFGLIGIILGFLIDLVFNEPNINDSTFSLFSLSMIQIVVTIFIAYLVDSTYIELIGIDSDTFLGFTAFTIIFFLVQQQLLRRLSLLYKRLTGRNI